MEQDNIKEAQSLYSVLQYSIMIREKQIRIRVTPEEEVKIKKFYKEGKSLSDWKFEHEMIMRLMDNWNTTHHRGKFY